MVLTQVAMSHSGRMLFCGTMSGAVRSIKFPLTDASEWLEHQAHSGQITKVSDVTPFVFGQRCCP